MRYGKTFSKPFNDVLIFFRTNLEFVQIQEPKVVEIFYFHFIEKIASIDGLINACIYIHTICNM